LFLDENKIDKNTKCMVSIVLLGPPGAGKGTQSKKIVERYRLTPVIPGHLMREHTKRGTELGKILSRHIDEGHLVPHEIVMQLVEEQILLYPDTSGFLFDGFPRAIAQANALTELLPKYGHQLDGILCLQVPDEEVKDRIQGRSKTEKRTDDTKVLTRLEVYKQETLPVLDYYKYEKRHQVFEIDGTGPEKLVFERIIQLLDPLYARNK
jgi:adenylate kinase